MLPEITEAPQDLIKVLEGSDISFSCGAKGAPKPVLKWKLQSHEEITEDDRISVEIDGTHSKLTIKVGLAFFYSVIICNKFV